MSGLMNDIHSQLFYIPRAIILTIIVALAFLFVKENDLKHIKIKINELLRQPWLILFLFYLAFILVSTLFVRWPRNPYNNILNSFGLYGDNGWNYECIENIILFIPYTFTFLKGVKPSKPWKSSLILAFCTTVSVELFQLLFWLGEFQISDILHNFIGGIIGCILWDIIKKLCY